MPTIEISQQTFEALRSMVRDFNETPDSVIQRLLTGSSKGESLPLKTRIESPKSPIQSLIESPGFLFLNGRDRYLKILKTVHDQSPKVFAERIPGIKLGTRIQIGESKEEIEKSGKSTFPEPIPGTVFWALTNLSNRSKRDVIFAVMRTLHFSAGDIEAAIQAIPDNNNRVVSFIDP